LIKLGDEHDDEEHKRSLDYLENGLKHRDSFVKKVVDGMGERVTKQELITRLRDTCFKSYILRMAI
jgi:hypothetical protein